jgi:membrane fusion protein, multidrug efflux system
MEEKRENRNHHKKKIAAFILFPVVIVLGAAGLYFYLRYKEMHISTDDAFVDGRVHVIASKISGTVRVLHVRDNQFVRKNDLILEIDPLDYDIRVKEAKAGLETERAKLTEIHSRVHTVKKQLAEIAASVEASRANLALQKANLDLARLEFERADLLLKKEVIPKQQHDNSKTKYDVAVAQAKAAQDQVRQAEASLETQTALIKQTESGLPQQEAQIRQKEATLKGAELNLGYTKICAPTEGYVTKRTVETGNQIQPAQPLMAVVPLAGDHIWITANYKETELKNVKPGQKVKIKVDTYPGKVFYGRVNSIMAGTGAVFSLFPPENATGNFVKIVQRIPVRIALEEGTDTDHLLRIGMSVVPTILVE